MRPQSGVARALSEGFRSRRAALLIGALAVGGPVATVFGQEPVAEVADPALAEATVDATGAEPAGAVALAGVAQALARGEVTPAEHIVCLVTGSGFKDERSRLKMTGEAGTPLVAGFAEFKQAVRAAVPR